LWPKARTVQIQLGFHFEKSAVNLHGGLVIQQKIRLGTCLVSDSNNVEFLYSILLAIGLFFQRTYSATWPGGLTAELPFEISETD
jgi:hypothetical protein